MPETDFLFRSDSYLKSVAAEVIAVNELGGIALDKTIFYAASGGQPGDSGTFVLDDGTAIEIATTIHPEGDKTQIVHVPAEGQPAISVGARVTANLDWEKRHKLMRMHTALHLLSVVFPFPVTGGSISAEKGRLDFDMPEVPDDLAALETAINEMVSANHPISEEWISDAEMAANPDLIKTMKVKPPSGQGRVRLIRIGTNDDNIDLQPCGGTHVHATGEVGPLKFGKIEKKGKQNRRVNLFFDAEIPA